MAPSQIENIFVLHDAISVTRDTRIPLQCRVLSIHSCHFVNSKQTCAFRV